MISRYVWASVHSFAWHAYQVADQRYIVERQIYRGIVDYQEYMQAKRGRALAKRIFQSTERLIICTDPFNQIGYVASYYRGLSLLMQESRLYRNDEVKP